MKYIKSIITLGILLPFFSMAFQLDWSGYYLGKAQYTYKVENKSSKYSIEQHLLMDSVARVSDGLSLNLRFLLGSGEKKSLGIAQLKNFVSHSDMKDASLNPIHFYSQYNSEFIQLSFGRMPFNFGLGLTYSSGEHFLEPVYNTRDGVAIRVEYDNFYVKPYGLVYFKENIGGQDVGAGNNFAVAVEAGYSSGDMELGVLYKTSIMGDSTTSFDNSPYRKDSTTNIFGRYDYQDFSFAAEWGSQKVWSQYAAALTVDWRTPFDSLIVSVSGAYVTDEYEAQTNWNPSFILWDYFYHVTGKTEDNHTWGLNNAIVFSPSVSMDLREDITVSLAHIWITDQTNMTIKNQELNAKVIYNSQKGFVWNNTIGFILMENQNRLSIRSAAAILF